MNLQTTQPSESSRLLRNLFVAIVGAVLTGVLSWLWWPIAAGMAWGGASVLIRPAVPRVTRYLGAFAVACLVGAAGLFGGPIAAGVAAAIVFVALAINA